MSLVPRLLQVWISAVIISIALVVGTVQAVLVGHVTGPFIAIALGVVIGPSLLRGARTGAMRARTAWAIAAVAIAIPPLATLHLDPADATYLSVSWYACGILAGAMLVWMARHRAAASVGITSLVAHTLSWAGPVGLVRLGVAAEVLLLIAMLLVYRSIRLVAEASVAAAASERRLIAWQAEQDAFHLERRRRLHAASSSALPLLRLIVDSRCELDPAAVQECRVLEQTIRDEIRGRRLLNDAVRAAVLDHRRRGAVVQVLDDGGLDALAPSAVEPLLDELAELVRSVSSSRIVIRTGAADSAVAVTLVATSPADSGADDDDDERVDLWRVLPRPLTAVAPIRPAPAVAEEGGPRDPAAAHRTLVRA